MFRAAMRVGRYAARSGGRNRGPARQWSGGTKAVWFIVLGGMAVMLIVRHPEAGLSVLGAVLFLILAAILAGSARRESMADIARQRHQARTQALDAQMRQWGAEDAARKAGRR